jgi:hypothetical protein
VAGFCFQPQQSPATGLDHSDPSRSHCNCELQIWSGHVRRQFEKRRRGCRFSCFIALAILPLEEESPPCVPDLLRSSLDVRHLKGQTGLAPLVRPRNARPVGWIPAFRLILHNHSPRMQL